MALRYMSEKPVIKKRSPYYYGQEDYVPQLHRDYYYGCPHEAWYHDSGLDRNGRYWAKCKKCKVRFRINTR